MSRGEPQTLLTPWPQISRPLWCGAADVEICRVLPFILRPSATRVILNTGASFQIIPDSFPIRCIRGSERRAFFAAAGARLSRGNRREASSFSTTGEENVCRTRRLTTFARLFLILTLGLSAVSLSFNYFFAFHLCCNARGMRLQRLVFVPFSTLPVIFLFLICRPTRTLTRGAAAWQSRTVAAGGRPSDLPDVDLGCAGVREREARKSHRGRKPERQ